MITRKLHQAYLETDKLIKFLEKRGWDSQSRLMYPIDRANEQIERIVNEAIDDVRETLERYGEQAFLASENRMTLTNGTPDPITKAEQRKARTELKRINKTRLALLELRF